MWIRFVLYGMGGWCGEIIFTAVTGSLSARDGRLMGRTYLWMFPIYGLLGPLFEPVHDAIRLHPWPLRALIWAVGFTLVEHSSGWLLHRLTGRCPWDYQAAGRRWAINPYIRWDYLPLWALVGLGMEPIHDFLVRLTPFLEIAWRGG